MLISAPSTFIIILNLAQSLQASPLTLEINQPLSQDRTLGNCSDLKHNLTAECWDVLNITDYLNHWWMDNGPQCQEHNITFASCYQQMTGWVQEQCDTTGPNMCDYPADFSGYSPQQAYILYSIFAIWQWFESIYEAIGSADVSASGRIGKIVKTINPERPSKQALGDFLQALSAMTPLISSPAMLVENIGKFIGKAITETALRQSPGVIKQLNPTGTLDSEFVQVNDLYDGLATVKETYQKNISAALALVQQDFTTFAAFADHGAFIAPRSGLQANTENLTLSLETFIISSSLSANNIILTLATDTDPHALATNGSLTTPSLVSCDHYDEHGVCSAWWYDPDTNAAYGLQNLGDLSTNYYDLMETIFSEGWTTGRDLFLGAKECADYVKETGGGNGPILDVNTMSPRCISNMQVCVWDKSCELMDRTCQFTNEYSGDKCKTNPDYMAKQCDWEQVSVNVPASYLGGLDTQGNLLEVCNN